MTGALAAGLAEPILVARGMTKQFGGFLAVKDVNLSVRRGSIHAVFPNLKERAASPGTKLSGGEQRMLAMARVLRTGVDIILLDEPTKGLAPVIVQRIGEVIRALKARGMTVVLVEQNFRFARKLADRFVVLEHGQIIGDFPAAELPARKAWLSEMLGVRG